MPRLSAPRHRAPVAPLLPMLLSLALPACSGPPTPPDASMFYAFVADSAIQVDTAIRIVDGAAMDGARSLDAPAAADASVPMDFAGADLAPSCGRPDGAACLASTPVTKLYENPCPMGPYSICFYDHQPCGFF